MAAEQKHRLATRNLGVRRQSSSAKSESRQQVKLGMR
jgi:hypothetical protein